jgi:hypothetical protein
MSLASYIRAHRLTPPVFHPPNLAPRVFDLLVRPVLPSDVGQIRVVEIFSLQKKTASIEIGGQNYLVADQALLNAFHFLNGLYLVDDAPDFVAAGMHQILAEACRARATLKYYAFFLKRAIEVKSVMREAFSVGTHLLDTFWQDGVVLAHEGSPHSPKRLPSS